MEPSRVVITKMLCPANAEVPKIFTAVGRAAAVTTGDASDPDAPAALFDEILGLMDVSAVEKSSRAGRDWRETGGIPLVVCTTEEADETVALRATVAQLQAELAQLKTLPAASTGGGGAAPETKSGAVKVNPLIDGDDAAEDGIDGIAPDGITLYTREEVETMKNKLDATSTYLGLETVNLHDIDENLKVETAALEDAKANGRYTRTIAGRIAAEQKGHADQSATVGWVKGTLSTLRSEFGAKIMPQALLGQKKYADAFAAALARAGAGASVERLAKVLAGIKCVPTASSGGGGGAGSSGKIKAGRQPLDGKTMPELQQTGLVEMKKLWVNAALPALKRAGVEFEGGFCEFVKDPARAFEKALRYDGDKTNVSDYGRGTAGLSTLQGIEAFMLAFLELLEANGYELATLKNTLNPAVDVTKSMGYRNILLNIRCPGSKHVVELQVNLKSIETIKHGRYGHVTYALLRACGYGNRVTFSGAFNAAMASAVSSGRALKLDVSSTVWTEADVAGLQEAMASPACRVTEIEARVMKPDGDDKVKLAAVAALTRAACATESVTMLKYVCVCVCVCVCRWLCTRVRVLGGCFVYLAALRLCRGTV